MIFVLLHIFPFVPLCPSLPLFWWIIQVSYRASLSLSLSSGYSMLWRNIDGSRLKKWGQRDLTELIVRGKRTETSCPLPKLSPEETNTHLYSHSPVKIIFGYFFLIFESKLIIFLQTYIDLLYCSHPPAKKNCYSWVECDTTWINCFVTDTTSHR